MRTFDPRLSFIDITLSATLYDLAALEAQQVIKHSSGMFKALKNGLLASIEHGSQKLAVTWPDGNYGLVTYSKRRYLETERVFKPKELGVYAQIADIYQVTDRSLISTYEKNYPALFPNQIKKHMEATLCHQ